MSVQNNVSLYCGNWKSQKIFWDNAQFTKNFVAKEDFLGDIRTDEKVEAMDVAVEILDVKEYLAMDVKANAIHRDEDGPQ